MSWIIPCVSPRGTLQENFLREASRGLLGASDKEPSHLSWLLLIWSSNGSTLTSSWVIELLTKSLRECPAEEAQFGRV